MFLIGKECNDQLEAKQCEAVKLNCAYSCIGCKTSVATSKDTTEDTTPPIVTLTTLQERTSGHSDESSTGTTLEGNKILVF